MAFQQNFVMDEVPRKSAILGVSSMVQTFCQSRPDCASLPEVQDIVIQHERILGEKCNAFGEDEEDTMILALKGLRNMKVIVHSAPVLENCYMDFTNPIPIRLAALDTIRKLNCQTDKFEGTLIKAFADTSIDSELRIGMYLALMDCPSIQTVERVKSLLGSEPVNQGADCKGVNVAEGRILINHFSFQLAHLCGLT